MELEQVLYFIISNRHCANREVLFSVIKTYSSSATEAGINSIIGYVNGIKDNIQEAYNAGHLIGEKALEGANKAVQNGSPSRKFEDYVAYYSVMGFVRWLSKLANA